MNISNKFTMMTFFIFSMPYIAKSYDRTKYAAETQIVRNRLHELSQCDDPQGPKLAAMIEKILDNKILSDKNFLQWFDFLKDRDCLQILKEYREWQNKSFMILGALFTVATVCMLAYQIYTHNC